ncbi:hypothetical protein BJ508DRAFT_409936 [Ascobolus immersus RN42]|uniref:Nudix hydrolase domain-containing protein n=1 Tax=Ascobolus immersus RN42 TaxID=1160509 RepID=A0A3N4IUT0_ASCIM|nr:hypothetical protein BJ508DRAFT_409936 [Ascobolus immersus RN42]
MSTTTSPPKKRLSNLDIVALCDGFPNSATHPSLYSERTSKLGYLVHGSHRLGYLLPSVCDALRNAAVSGPYWEINGKLFSIKGETEAERTANLKYTVDKWREIGLFKVLKGWRNELYPAYIPGRKGGEKVFDVERAACALFGLISYGVHLTAYVEDEQGLRIWVPRRSKTKSTYGGMLDNTVAGGISSGMGVMETVVKESMEEASIPEEVARQAKPVGCVSYFYVRSEKAGGEAGLFQPEVEYIYDLKLDASVIPQPLDGEVEEFYLWDVEKVKEELALGNFKPNCGVVLIDFFIRHGIITPDDEPNYIEICSRLHRRLEFPTR